MRTFDDVGVWSAARRKATAANINDLTVERIVAAWRDGAAHVGGEKIDAGMARAEAADWMAREITARLTELPAAARFDHVILCSGGATEPPVLDRVKGLYSQARVIDSPVTANLRGLLAMEA